MTQYEDMRTNEVDPSRLARGTWCHAKQRQASEGDISASYLADTIGLHARRTGGGADNDTPLKEISLPLVRPEIPANRMDCGV